VIEQLKNAYVYKRIDLFEDLFPEDGSYRFYMSHRLEDELRLTNPNLPSEQYDAQFFYVPAGTYYYWNSDDEIRGHTRLFSDAHLIALTGYEVHPDLFRYHRSPSGDTIGVEVLMEGGELKVEVWVEGDVITATIYTATIERQVFYLVKDPKNNWVIAKWFDLGTAS
jgi:hypothetical protein